MTPEGIVEQGTYDDLIQEKGALYKLHNMQKVENTNNPATERPLTSDTTVATSITTAAPSAGGSTVQLLPKTRTSLEAATSCVALPSSPLDRTRAVWPFLVRFNRGTWALAVFGLIWAMISGCASTVQSYLFANVSQHSVF